MKNQPMNFVPVVRGLNSLTVKAAGDEHEIVLIGAIGKSWWDDSGITEKEFRDALKAIPKSGRITLKINSEGGSVKEGLGIYNAIKERRDTITARITGYALSIASVFPLGAGKVVSPKSAIWMMHKAWSWNQGNADDMRQAAEMLDAHDQTLAGIYAAETGKPEAEILTAMEKETWIKGADAVAYGLADETDDAADDAAAAYRPIAQSFLDRCKNLAPDILNALRVPSVTDNGDTQKRTAPSPAQAGDQTGAPQPAAPITSNTDANSAATNAGGQPPNHNQTKQMDKTKIVALLKKHGIEAKAEWTDEQFETALAQLAKTNSDAKLEAIEAKLELAENRRITDKITAFVDAGKITKAEVPIFVSAAKVDEKGTLDILNAKEVQTPGGNAAGFEITERNPDAVNENGVHGRKILPELNNLFAAHKTPEARYEAMKQEFPNLFAKALKRDNGVQASNTMSSTVTTNFLILGVTTKLSGKFAMANLFTKDAEQDPYKPLAAGIRKFNTTTTDGSKVAKNPTNWATLAGGTNGNPDSVVDPITITPDYYASGGHLTFTQLNSGFRVADIYEAKLRDLAAKVAQVLTAPITTANFTTNEALISAPAAFGFSDLADLQGKLKKSNVKNLILDGEYIARVSNTPGFYQMAGTVGGAMGAWRAFGWDNVALHTDWSGAGANVRGFGCGDQAIGIISGVPIDFPEGIPGNTLQRVSVRIPDVDLVVSVFVWFDLNERVYRFTNDIILGATLIDETDGVLVKSA